MPVAPPPQTTTWPDLSAIAGSVSRKAAAEKGPLAEDRLQQMAGAFGAFTQSRLATFHMRRLRSGATRWSSRQGTLLSHEELATLFHPPTATVAAEKMQTTEFRELEPPASFNASVRVQDGKVIQISAGLFRTMDIYPTFGASAGMVEEDLETSRRHEYEPSHFYFPTPVGKPYLRVQLDSAASEIQRKHAFDFSFRCLTKPGWGCDLSCDYLPFAWQDWRESLKGSASYPTFLYERYPMSTRCKME